MDDDTLTDEDREYQARLDALPNPGTRVRLTCNVERYPHFIAQAGRRGTVIEATEEVFSVRMDDYLPGAEDWQNEVHWYPRNCDQWPDGELEVLLTSRYEDVTVDPAVEEAILNIQQAIRVIAPIWESMSRFGHSQADDVAGAQADLEQAIRWLKGEEEPG